jgi:hypothetical protein
MTDPLDVAAVDVLGIRDLCGIALQSPYGLPPRNAAAPPPTPRPGTRPCGNGRDGEDGDNQRQAYIDRLAFLCNA